MGKLNVKGRTKESSRAKKKKKKKNLDYSIIKQGITRFIESFREEQNWITESVRCRLIYELLCFG